MRWCRWVRNENVDGDLRPVYRAGASFVDWQALEPAMKATGIERQIDDAIDGWIEKSRNASGNDSSERTIVHRAPRS